MNMIKQVQMFQALDGSHHATERGALLSSVAHCLECTEDDVLTHVEPNLSKLLPLLSKLNDPRNAPPKAEPLVIDVAGFTGNEVGTEGGMVVEPIERPDDHPVPRDGDECVDPGDLRVGQKVRFSGELDGIIREIDPEERDGLCVFISFNPEGPVPDSWNAMVAFDEINAVLAQPEDMMDLETAKRELAAIESWNATSGEATMSPLDHKRRILLHRRIEALEDDNA